MLTCLVLHTAAPRASGEPGLLWQFDTGGCVVSTPAVAGDLLLVASCSGLLHAFDRETGDARWSHDTGLDGSRAGFHGDPLVVGDRLLIGSDSSETGHLYAFEIDTGEVLWKLPLGRGVSTDLLGFGTRALTVTADGDLINVDVGSGGLLWTVSPDVPPREAQRSSGVLRDDLVFFAGADSKLYAVEVATGNLLWRRDLGAPASTSLAALGDHVYVGTRDGRLLMVDMFSGRLRGMNATEGQPVGSPVVLEDSLLLLLTGPDRLVRLEASLDRILWTAAAPASWSSYRPLFHEGGILVGDTDGVLFSLDPGDGSIRWTETFPGAIRTLGAHGDVIHVGTQTGTFAAYRPLPGGGLLAPRPEAIPEPAADPPADAPAGPCGTPIPGASRALGAGDLVLLGGPTGTAELPALIGDLACAAAQAGHDVIVGLELPEDESDIVDAALTAPTVEEASAMMLEAPSFRRESQDGRSSRAILDLVVRLRSLRASGRTVRAFPFEFEDRKDRERRVAENIARLRRDHTDATVLILTTASRARRAPGTVASHLTALGYRATSVLVAHAGGERWACPPAAAATCGPAEAAGDDETDAPSFTFPDAPPGPDALLHVGRLTASPPAVSADAAPETPPRSSCRRDAAARWARSARRACGGSPA